MGKRRRKSRRRNHFGKWILALTGIAMAVVLFFAQLLFPEEAAPPPAHRGPSVPPIEESGGETLQTRLQELEARFPSGSYWNHCGYELSPGEESWSIVTEIPCDHEALGKEYCNSYRGATDEFFPFYDGSQCLGFSSMLSDQLFGADAPVSMHRSYERLRPGDQIRLTVENHSMLVIGKSEAGVAVAEVNADYNTCQISWGRELSRETLENYGEEIEYFTRYSDDGETVSLIDSAEGNDVNAPAELLELPAEDGE